MLTYKIPQQPLQSKYLCATKRAMGIHLFFFISFLKCVLTVKKRLATENDKIVKHIRLLKVNMFAVYIHSLKINFVMKNVINFIYNNNYLSHIKMQYKVKT
jgi:hypothetical protein